MSKKYLKQDWVQEIWTKIINGQTRYEIIKELEVDTYGWGSDKWSRAQRYKVVKQAYDECAIELADNREKQRNLMYDRYLSIYEDAVNNADRTNARQTLDSLTKLMGLNEPEKLMINSDVIVQIDFNANTNNDEDVIEVENEEG
ncbi:hypothetical protein [Bacteroides sp. 51]|uniref:hypothetical protein n=1 Tax=Bacteroides sp. 51 TaxID=2302938 RepID=UPI0013D72E22|nr:hypothetical protein [Bacteroides sp. 51]NDV83954.1 hypothetical protein [Bacteroides sp. 51]